MIYEIEPSIEINEKQELLSLEEGIKSIIQKLNGLINPRNRVIIISISSPNNSLTLKLASRIQSEIFLGPNLKIVNKKGNIKKGSAYVFDDSDKISKDWLNPKQNELSVLLQLSKDTDFDAKNPDDVKKLKAYHTAILRRKYDEFNIKLHEKNIIRVSIASSKNQFKDPLLWGDVNIFTQENELQ